MKRLSLVAGILLLGTLASCGGGGGISVGGGGGDLGGGSGVVITDDGGGSDDGGDGGELAPTGGGGGSPVAVEIPALGDVNNLPFMSGEVVSAISNSLSAQFSTSKSLSKSLPKSVQSLLPEASVSLGGGGILLSGAEEFKAVDSMVACATAQEWQDIWVKNAQTNDNTLCKVQATAQHAADNDVDLYDGNYHIFDSQGDYTVYGVTHTGMTKHRFRVVRGDDNTIERYESFTCHEGDTAEFVQDSYSLYAINGQAITIYTKYFSQISGGSVAKYGNIATLTGTLYAADPTKYTAKTLENLKTYDQWSSEGAFVSYQNTISTLNQYTSGILIDSGSASTIESGNLTPVTISGVYSSANIINPVGATFNPANYRMLQGAGVLEDAELINDYYGYNRSKSNLPDTLTECWDNNMLSIACLGDNTNFLAINGHSIGDRSVVYTAEFESAETWASCAGVADIPRDDSLYTTCTNTMDASFVSEFGCYERLKGNAVYSVVTDPNGLYYTANTVPNMTLRLNHGELDAIFGFTEDYIPDPLTEFGAYYCGPDGLYSGSDPYGYCSSTSIGFTTVEGPAYLLEILEQPTLPAGIRCQVTSGGNGSYCGAPGLDGCPDGYSGSPEFMPDTDAYIKCAVCAGACPTITDSAGKVATKMVMYTSDYDIDGLIGFNATDVRTRADDICRYSTKLPASCGTPHAFISISASDDLASMPTNFGFSDALQIESSSDVIIATMWSMLVGPTATLTNNLVNAGVMPAGNWWSGSDLEGATHSDSCSGWTSDTEVGIVGDASTTTNTWISMASQSCGKTLGDDQMYMLLCICPHLETPP